MSCFYFSSFKNISASGYICTSQAVSKYQGEDQDQDHISFRDKMPCGLFYIWLKFGEDSAKTVGVVTISAN